MDRVVWIHEQLGRLPTDFRDLRGQSAGGLLDIVFTSEWPEIAGTWAARAV
jgi:hypothetical protein